MQDLVIQATKHTPFIHFIPSQGRLVIQGESYPENTAEFYRPVFAWLEEYLSNLGEQDLVAELEIIYFNSSSSKVLMNLFDLLEEQAQSGRKVKVLWTYDEDNQSALEYGEEFQEDLEHLPFEIIKKP